MVSTFVAIALSLSVRAAPWGKAAREELDRVHAALEQTRERIGVDPGVERVEIGRRNAGKTIHVTTLDYAAERRLMARFPSDPRINDVPLVIECRHRVTAFHERVRERVTHSAAGFTSAGMRYPTGEPPYLEIGFDQAAHRRAFENFYPAGSSVEGVRVVTVLTGTPRFQAWTSIRNFFRNRWKTAGETNEPGDLSLAVRDFRKLLASDFPRAAVEEGEAAGGRYIAVRVSDKEDAVAFLAKFPEGRTFRGFEVSLSGLSDPSAEPRVEAKIWPHQSAAEAAGALAPKLQELLRVDMPGALVGVGEHEGRTCFTVFVRDKEDAFELARKFPPGSNFNGLDVRLTGMPPGADCEPGLGD